MTKNSNNSGFIFLEILIAIALFSIVFITLLDAGALVLNVSYSIQKQTQANFLVKEELEAVRNFRDGTIWAVNGLGSASIVNPSSPYHLVNSSNNWTLISGPETTGDFVRQVVFDKVSRDGSQNIENVYNPSHDDADTRKITVTISWSGKTLQTVSYLTNWK